MNSTLQHLFNSIETQRQELIRSLVNLSSEKLNTQPEGKWSINQIIAHLITAEQLSVHYLNKKILGAEEAEDTGMKEELKMLLLIASQRLPLKFTAPKKVVEHTPKEEDLTKLISAWDTARSDFKKVLENVEGRHLKRKVYRHVHVGMLNIQHAVKFFGEHVGHHTPQIKRLL